MECIFDEDASNAYVPEIQNTTTTTTTETSTNSGTTTNDQPTTPNGNSGVIIKLSAQLVCWTFLVYNLIYLMIRR